MLKSEHKRNYVWMMVIGILTMNFFIVSNSSLSDISTIVPLQLAFLSASFSLPINAILLFLSLPDIVESRREAVRIHKAQVYLGVASFVLAAVSLGGLIFSKSIFAGVLYTASCLVVALAMAWANDE